MKMATVFKKPKRNFRRKIAQQSDSEEEGNDAMADESAEDGCKESCQAMQDESKAKGKKKKRDKEVPSNLLSFDNDEGDAEIFKVKKSSHSKRIAKQLRKESLKEKEKEHKDVEPESEVSSVTSPVTVVVDSAEEKLRQLREELCTLNGDDALQQAETVDSDEENQARDRQSVHAVLKRGEIPDANLIHMIRKKRQLAREIGEFVPLEEEANPENSNSRLVRDDDNDKSDDDEEEEGRIDFSVNVQARERQKIKDEFLAAEHGSDKENSDLENGWEEQQIRKAVTIPQVVPEQDIYSKFTQGAYEQRREETAFNSNTSYVAQPVTMFQPFSLASKGTDASDVSLELIQKKLRERLDSMHEVHRAHLNERDSLSTSLQETEYSINKSESNAGKLEERFKFFQEMRGYVRDLVECLNEKVPVIHELETKMLNLLRQRADKLVSRRQQDVRDQCQDYTASKTQIIIHVDAKEAKQRRVAEREARRSRRRRARENQNIIVHHEGLSSDDEENQSEIMKFNLEKQDILHTSKQLFEDVEEDFCEIDIVRQQFEAWKFHNSESYSEAYIGLCLPKLFNPLIRIQLLDWNPLQDRETDFENSRWFECLAFYGFQEGAVVSVNDEDSIKLLPSVVEKVILPRLTALAENVWDPMSTSETSRLVNLVRRLSLDYPTVNGDSKYTQALLKALVWRIKKTLDDDVFMPLYPKSIIENRSSGPAVFFHRQSWSCIKLLGNILCWYGILATKMLQQLALDGLLNRYIILGLQNSPLNSEVFQKCQAIVATFPKQWFTNLEEKKTLRQLENLCRFLVCSAESLIKSTTGQRESAEVKDHFRTINRLLLSIQALDYAKTLAEDKGLRQ